MQIDAHQHFWSYSEAEYGWIADNGLDALKRDFLPADLEPLMKAAGVDGTIAVQARQDVDETEWLIGLAAANPWILGVVGWVDLVDPAVGETLARLRERSSRLVGVRHVVQDEANGFLDGAEFRRGVGTLAAHGLTYDLLVFAHQMEEAVRFCAAFPEQPIVLDHLGKPRIEEGEVDAWAGALRELGAMDHVMCKVSGMVTEADWEHWTLDDLRPYVDVTLEAFGPDRLMFGSDWPVCTLAADYARVHSAALELVSAPMTGAARFYGI